ncbi:MAG: hypothetical protein U0641_03300 [Anaerolineae bacterium]
MLSHNETRQGLEFTEEAWIYRKDVLIEDDVRPEIRHLGLEYLMEPVVFAFLIQPRELASPPSNNPLYPTELDPILGCPPSLQRFAVCHDLDGFMPECLKIPGVEVSRAEALLHEGIPLLVIRSIGQQRIRVVERAQELGIVGIND